ncbi:tetratricopeptide repeat protein [Rhizobiaceae bacterium BDR2-2]|uniref:Tetratricopeptide repeat protein n=1 Tax=Ectorhizobium quercum TaxID=2965071 RepID=A0AAE3STX3_9HYPH|nr:tetratricopeptide repeat protein [Ectorhizobium quercum]MCX8996635.1 tetratricopeptide repeat protein [Ectorhizobium quercum]
MANEHDSFIREVNEEIRSEQMRMFWARYGRIVIGGAVAVVLATAGWRGYEYWAERQASASGDQFIAALALVRDGKTAEAEAALQALEKDGAGSYPVLARLRAATLLAEKGEAAGAIAAFTAIGQDGSVPDVMRDTARLRAAYLLVDTGSYEQVAAEAEQIAVPANALRHSAREVLGLSAYKSGDMVKAKDWFEQTATDAQAPSNVANRARMMLDLINASGKAP